MSKTWIEYAIQRDNAEIVALVDLHLENARHVADRYQLRVPIFA